MTPAPRLKSILPWLRRIRSIVIVMSTGAQDIDYDQFGP
jgi:hypothetical protein